MKMKPCIGLGPSPHTVRVALAERGVTLSFVAVDLMGGEKRRAPDGFESFTSRPSAAASA